MLQLEKIAVLSAAGKVLVTVILNRIKEAVDRLLRQEQDGFRKKQSCCEQVFALRQIIEKAQARDKSLHLNFIYFRKAFDCVHRDTLWAILRAYGLPEKITNIIRSFYGDSRSTIRVNGSLGEWFGVISGVRQGCVLSPLLFAVAIDWVTKRAVEAASRSGLKRTEGDIVTLPTILFDR